MSEPRHPKTGDFLRGRLRHAMTDREKDLMETLFGEIETIGPDKRVMARGHLYDHSTILIDGFAMRTIDDDKDEQIVSLHVAGDFVDLHAFALKRLDHNIVTLSEVKVAYVHHDKLKDILANEPHLARLFWFSTLLDAAIHREWIMTLGKLRALGRAAHFFSELHQRLTMVDRVDGLTFQTPLTQLNIANVCGTTPVHINRVLRDLRESGAAIFKRGQVTILDLERLHNVARFSPAYLYGEGDLAVRHELSEPIGDD